MRTGIEPRLWYRCSLADWLKLRSKMDEWEKSLQSMNSREFAIHRKLGEAAGLAHRYIIPARGSDKSLFVDSFDDPEKIFRKHRKDHKPQEFVTIKDGAFERWVRKDALNQQAIEDVCKMFRELYPKEATMRRLATVNPYMQPEGYWYDPSWEVRDDGSLRLREVSIMPEYLWDKEV